MGQFKPMVKMETTEPSVVLKLKKGGHVNKKEAAKAENGHKPMHKLDGGAMGDMGVMNAPAMIRPPVAGGPSIGSPRRPSMADRQKAMAMAKMMKGRPPAAAPMSGLPTMKKGGKAGGEVETPAMHKMEMKGIKGIGKELKAHEGKPASKAHAGLKKGGMATGGVRMGAGGFKTGGVAKGKAGGYKTGGVALGNAGGFKKGGAAKKFADGGRVDSGRAVSMPQGHKKPTPPVATNLRAGTFKKGGSVSRMADGGIAGLTGNYQGQNITSQPQGMTPAYSPMRIDSGNGGNNPYPYPFTPQQPEQGGGGGAMQNTINNMNTNANTNSNINSNYNNNSNMPQYGNPFMPQMPGMAMPTPYQPSYQPPDQYPVQEYRKGGRVSRKAEGGATDETKGYERWKANEKAENLADRNAMSNLPSKMMDLGSRVVNKIGEKLKGLGGVTDTVREVSKTVVPAKKRGGMC